MERILISVKPKEAAKILNGDKTLEIRKSVPKEWAGYLNGRSAKKPEPMAAYIYCTKGDCEGHLPKWYAGKVIGSFILKDVYAIFNEGPTDDEANYLVGRKAYRLPVKQMSERSLLARSFLTYDELDGCLKGKTGYALEIDDPETLDEPKSIWQMVLYSKPKKARKFGPYIILESKQISKAPASWCYVRK